MKNTVTFTVVHTVFDRIEEVIGSNRYLFLFAAVVTIWLAVKIFITEVSVPYSDAIRYLNFSLNLLYHGILSENAFVTTVIPQPTMVMGGPLIALELALAALIDPNTLETFICAVETDGNQTACQANLFGLQLFNFLETLIALFFIWKISFLVFRRVVGAVLCVLFTMFNPELFSYSGLALTEPLYFAIACAFTYYFLKIARQESNFATAGLAGLLLGLIILSKPVAQPLIILCPIFLIFIAYSDKITLRHAVRQAFIVALVSIVLITPWLIRNYGITGEISFSSRKYLEAALSHRIAFNQMSWNEWMVGWIYFLPDFGDSLAASLFPSQLYQRLGWDSTGYYVYGRDILHKLVMVNSADQSPVSYLIFNLALADFVKHMAVSALLLWRGAMVGGYIGLVAILCLPYLLFKLTPQQRWNIALIAFPAVMIAGLNAGLSVSITRYNMALIPLYSATLTYMLIFLCNVLASCMQSQDKF